MQPPIYFALMLLTAALALALARYVARRRTAPGAPALVVLMLAAAVWSTMYAFELIGADLPTKLLWVKLEYLGIVSIAPAWFVFAIQYTERPRWLTHNPRSLAALALVPLITLLLAWTNEAHGLIWSRTGLAASGPLLLLDVDYGVWNWVSSAYSYLLMLLGSIWFVAMLRRSAHLYRWQAGVALVGMLAPLVANALFLSRLGPFPGLDLTPFGFALGGLAYAWSLFRLRLLDIVPIARRAVVDGLGDGVIVLDARHRIVDANRAAQRLVGSSDVELIGRPAAQALRACAPLVEQLRDLNGAQTELTLGLGEGSALRYYDVQISPLTNHRGDPIGRLVVLHNVTRRKQTEAEIHRLNAELEQRVVERTAQLQTANRELEWQLKELAVMHEIAVVGVESVNEDTLIERAVQIIGETLAWDIFSVLLLDETAGGLRHHPASRGLTDEIRRSIIPLGTGIIGTVAARGEPACVPDVSREPAYVAAHPTIQSELAVPMKIGERVIGALNVESTRPDAFSGADERLLLTVARQLATALEKIRLLNRTVEALAHEQHFNEVARLIGSTLDLQTVIVNVVRLAVELVNAESGLLYFIAPDGQSLITPYAFNPPKGFTAQPVPRGEGTLWRVIETGKPELVADYRRDPDAWPGMMATGLRALVGVPLEAGETSLGVLAVFSLSPDKQFTERDLILVESVARQAAVAIQNARLFDAESAARQQAEVLRAANRVTTQSLNLDTVLMSLLAYLNELIPYDTANTMIMETENRLTVRVLRHHERWTDTGLIRRRTLEVEDYSTLHTIVTTQKSLLVPDTAAYPDWVPLAGTEYIRCWLGVPLVVSGKVIGLYSLSKAQPRFFTEDQIRLAEAVATQAAVAIQNSRLFEQVQMGREELQMLSRRLVEAQETERRSISRELHDQVGQTLTGLKLMLAGIPYLPPDTTRARLGEAQALVSEVMEHIHDMSLALRPTMLDDQGLRPALLWLFDRFTAQTGVRVHSEMVGLSASGDASYDERPPAEVETAAYRITQEALTNVARHAHVNDVWVRFFVEETQLQLQIWDNGSGFSDEVTLASSHRAGLAGMKERAALLGGWLEIVSSSGSGTLVTAILPLKGHR